MLKKENLDYKKDLLKHSDYIDLLYKIVTDEKKIKFKEESYIIGLEGEWGIGKTWILNKLEEKIKNSKDYRNNLIYLDSWTSFGYEYFIKNFYIELQNKSLGN